MIKHIFTMLVLMTFTGCLLTENEEQKESNYQDNRSSSSVYYSSEKEEIYPDNKTTLEVYYSSESKETYLDNRSSSSVYSSYIAENQIEKQNQNTIKAGEYKSQLIQSSITYEYDSDWGFSGLVFINKVLNIKLDNTYFYEVNTNIRGNGESFDLSNNMSGNLSYVNEAFCLLINDCYPIRNVSSTSFEIYFDYTKPTRFDKSDGYTEGFTTYMDFAGWIKMNRQ
jgi:hypothetical protein